MYYSTDKLFIYNDDFLNVRIRSNSVDLIVTSPPYNVGIKYNTYRDDLEYQEYLDFTEKWLTKSFRLLKSTGRLCLNVPIDNKYHHTIGADVTHIAKSVGFKYRSTILWNKRVNTKKTWGSWLSASAPHISTPVEYILLFYKEKWKKPKGKSTLDKQSFIEWTNGLWTFNNEINKDHPAPFPIELAYRCINLFSYVENLVLDPFAGSGTTLIAAALSKRRAIGVEIDQQYCELIKKRILNTPYLYQNSLFKPPA